METQSTGAPGAAAPTAEELSLKARDVKAWHQKDAAPGNQVEALKCHVTLGELSSALSNHMYHRVPHPTDPGQWVTRKSFRLFIEHELIPGSDEGEAAQVKPIQGTDEKDELTLHAGVKTLCSINKLTAKVLAQTATGAEVEFTRA